MFLSPVGCSQRNMCSSITCRDLSPSSGRWTQRSRAKFYKCKYWHLGRNQVGPDWWRWRVVSIYTQRLHRGITYSTTKTFWRPRKNMCAERIWEHNWTEEFTWSRLQKRVFCCGWVPMNPNSQTLTSVLLWTVYKMESKQNCLYWI